MFFLFYNFFTCFHEGSESAHAHVGRFVETKLLKSHAEEVCSGAIAV